MTGRALWVLPLLWLSSCATLPPKQPTGLEPAVVAKEQARRIALTRQIAGKVGLRLRGKDGSLSGKGRLISQLPGDFRLELRDPLGRVQYVLAEAGDRLSAYYPRQKLAYVEAQWGRRYVQRFLGLDFSLPELRDLFLGILPARWRKLPITGWAWDANQGVYVGHLESASARVTMGVDGVTAALTFLNVERGEERVKVGYSDFDRVLAETDRGDPGVALAHVVKVELAHPASVVEIDWQSVERLEHPKEKGVFQLSLPSDVKQQAL